MKPLHRILLAFLFPCFACAEEPTLLQEQDYWNFYFQPELTLSQVDDDNAEFLGAEIGASLNERFDIGLASHWLINDVDLEVDGVDDPSEGEIWYGGLTLRYHFMPCEMVDWSFQTLFAGGSIDVGNKTDGTNAETDFILIEPSVSLSVNLTEHLVMGARLGYRFADGSDSRLIQDDQLENIVGALFIRFDEF